MPTAEYNTWVAKGRPYTVATPVKELVAWARSKGIQILGVIGDESHLKSSNPQDHTPFSRTAWPGKLPGYVVTACDLKEGAWADKFIDETRRGLHPWVKYINHKGKQHNFKYGYKVYDSSDWHCHVSVRTDFILAHINMEPSAPVVVSTEESEDMKYIYAKDRGWAIVTPHGFGFIDNQAEADLVAAVLGNAKVVSAAAWDATLNVIKRLAGINDPE